MKTRTSAAVLIILTLAIALGLTFRAARAATVDVNVGLGKDSDTLSSYPLVNHFWGGLDTDSEGFVPTFYNDSATKGMGVVFSRITNGFTVDRTISSANVNWSNSVSESDQWFRDNVYSLATQVIDGNTYLWIGTDEGGAYRYNWAGNSIDVHLTVKNTGCYGTATEIDGWTIKFDNIHCAHNSLCSSGTGCDGVSSIDLSQGQANNMIMQVNSQLFVIKSCNFSGGSWICDSDTTKGDQKFSNAGRVGVQGLQDMNRFVIHAGLGSNQINDIKVDGDNNVWFGTGRWVSPNGKDGGFSRFSQDSGGNQQTTVYSYFTLFGSTYGSASVESLAISGDSIFIGGKPSMPANTHLFKCSYGGGTPTGCIEYDVPALSTCDGQTGVVDNGGQNCLHFFNDLVYDSSAHLLLAPLSTVFGAGKIARWLSVPRFTPFASNGDGLQFVTDGGTAQGYIKKLYDGDTIIGNSPGSNRINALAEIQEEGDSYVWMATDLGITAAKVTNILNGDSTTLNEQNIKRVFSSKYLGISRSGEMLGGWTIGAPNRLRLSDNMVTTIDVSYNASENKYDVWAGSFGGLTHYYGGFTELESGGTWKSFNSYRPVSKILRVQNGSTTYLVLGTGFKYIFSAHREGFEEMATINAGTPNKAFHEIHAQMAPFNENRGEKSDWTYYANAYNIYTEDFFNATVSCNPPTPACAEGNAYLLHWNYLDPILDHIVYDLDMTPHLEFNDDFPLELWKHMYQDGATCRMPNYDEPDERPGHDSENGDGQTNHQWNWQYWHNLIWAFLAHVEERYGKNEVSKWRFAPLWEGMWPCDTVFDNQSIFNDTCWGAAGHDVEDFAALNRQFSEAFQEYQPGCNYRYNIDQSGCYLGLVAPGWNYSVGDTVMIAEEHNNGSRGLGILDDLEPKREALDSAGMTHVPINRASGGPVYTGLDDVGMNMLGLNDRNTLMANFMAQTVAFPLYSNILYKPNSEFLLERINNWPFVISGAGTYNNFFNFTNDFYGGVTMDTTTTNAWALLARLGDQGVKNVVAGNSNLFSLGMQDSHAPGGLYHALVLDSRDGVVDYQNRQINPITLTVYGLNPSLTYEAREFKIDEKHGDAHDESFIQGCAVDPGPCALDGDSYTAVVENAWGMTVKSPNTAFDPLIQNETSVEGSVEVMDYSVYLLELMGPPVLASASDSNSIDHFDLATDRTNRVCVVYQKGSSEIRMAEWSPDTKTWSDENVATVSGPTITNVKVAVNDVYANGEGDDYDLFIDKQTPVQLAHNHIVPGTVTVFDWNLEIYLDPGQFIVDYANGMISQSPSNTLGSPEEVYVAYYYSIVYAAWTQVDGNTTALKFRAKGDSTWSSISSIYSDSGTHAVSSDFDLAVDPAGGQNIFAVVKAVEDGSSLNSGFRQYYLDGSLAPHARGTGNNLFSSSGNDTNRVLATTTISDWQYSFIGWVNSSTCNLESVQFEPGQYDYGTVSTFTCDGDLEIASSLRNNQIIVHATYKHNSKLKYRAYAYDDDVLQLLFSATVDNDLPLNSSVAVDPQGAVHIMYVKDGGTYNQVVYKKYKILQDGGTSTPISPIGYQDGVTISNFNKSADCQKPLVRSDYLGNLNFLWLDEGNYFYDSPADTHRKLVYRYRRQ